MQPNESPRVRERNVLNDRSASCSTVRYLYRFSRLLYFRPNSFRPSLRRLASSYSRLPHAVHFVLCPIFLSSRVFLVQCPASGAAAPAYETQFADPRHSDGKTGKPGILWLPISLPPGRSVGCRPLQNAASSLPCLFWVYPQYLLLGRTNLYNTTINVIALSFYTVQLHLEHHTLS